MVSKKHNWLLIIIPLMLYALIGIIVLSTNVLYRSRFNKRAFFFLFIISMFLFLYLFIWFKGRFLYLQTKQNKEVMKSTKWISDLIIYIVLTLWWTCNIALFGDYITVDECLAYRIISIISYACAFIYSIIHLALFIISIRKAQTVKISQTNQVKEETEAI
ncbi:hypothetical protein [Mycoplasmopsis primatum]|uniref:hypothetical protein n=1 Tax=Mycoplasmopsis primatum TaxID=55604 RepID=UPI0004978FC3|nr:hypothetical protein [Mycoplasmopsis primatum]